MSEEKMNSEGNLSQNKNDEEEEEKIDEPISNNISESNNNIYINNIVHITFIIVIYICLLIIALLELIIRTKNSYLITIFDYLVNLSILLLNFFACFFIFYRDENSLKGIIYYPFYCFFWGIPDILSIFFLQDFTKFIFVDFLKIIKEALIFLSLLINIAYLMFCKN